jgi:signal transduction histidine kinase
LPSEYKLGNLSEEYIDKIVHDSMLIIDHMSETIDDFSCFFKPDKKMISFNIKHSVARAIQLVKASCDYNNIKIIMNCVDEAVIQGHPNEYSQVVLNILSNAKDALLTNKTEYPQIIITTRVKDGRSVVTISDNAGGIPDKIIDKVFNPFFTTKGEHGSGIGLFMSKYIIERNMKGILSAVNKDEGAEFIIEV